MRCRICNAVSDISLADDLASYSSKRFYPDPEAPLLSSICHDCADEVYEGNLEQIEASEDSDGYGLDAESENEVFQYLEELDKAEENM